MISTDRVSADLKDLAGQSLSVSHRRAVHPIAFIEEKAPDYFQLAETLRLSAERGLWANFGPVCSLLESTLEQQLRVPSSRAVVMCSSGTAALVSLVALKEYRAHRRLRWVISGYGFRASHLGPLADAIVLDCDASGMLDLDALRSLDPENWDGVVVTNVFGLKSDLREYISLCRDRKKELIVDNAAGFDSFVRDDEQTTADEILSFHQTKPWGMGEGGCAILPRRHAAIFRSLINGGLGLDAQGRTWASNSKISEVSCALILQRVLKAQEWSCAYRLQAQRIGRIALRTGLRMLAPVDLDTLTPPHLPMLAPCSVTTADLANDSFVIQKYYQPLSGECRSAAAIYDRIVNIPCHPDMALLADEEIATCLARLPGCSI